MLRPTIPAHLRVRGVRRGRVRGETMWRDRWFALGVIGAALACLACLTPVAVLVLGAIGLGAWTGRLDLVLVPLLAGFVVLAVYRHRMRQRAR